MNAKAPAKTETGAISSYMMTLMMRMLVLMSFNQLDDTDGILLTHDAGDDGGKGPWAKTDRVVEGPGGVSSVRQRMEAARRFRRRRTPGKGVSTCSCYS